MRKDVLIILMAICTLTCVNTLAQESEDEANVAVDYWVTVDTQKVQEYEEGLKQHFTWRRQQGDTWSWNTWELVRGERLGNYLISSGEHKWADFDSQPLLREGPLDYRSRVGQFQTSIGSTMSVTLTKLSKFPDEPLADGALAWIYVYTLKPGKRAQFTNAISRVHEAAQKTNWPSSYIWVAGLTGGEPAMVLVLPRKNWDGFKPMAKDPEAIVEEAFGRDASILIFDQIGASIESMSSELWRYREDLSYRP
jgi:hypothetical protein